MIGSPTPFIGNSYTLHGNLMHIRLSLSPPSRSSYIYRYAYKHAGFQVDCKDLFGIWPPHSLLAIVSSGSSPTAAVRWGGVGLGDMPG